MCSIGSDEGQRVRNVADIGLKGTWPLLSTTEPGAHRPKRDTVMNRLYKSWWISA